MDAQNYKISFLKFLLEDARKIIIESANFYLLLFYIVQSVDAQ